MDLKTNQNHLHMICTTSCGFYGNPRTNSMSSIFCEEHFFSRGATINQNDWLLYYLCYCNCVVVSEYCVMGCKFREHMIYLLLLWFLCWRSRTLHTRNKIQSYNVINRWYSSNKSLHRSYRFMRTLQIKPKTLLEYLLLYCVEWSKHFYFDFCCWYAHLLCLYGCNLQCVIFWSPCAWSGQWQAYWVTRFHCVTRTVQCALKTWKLRFSGVD